MKKISVFAAAFIIYILINIVPMGVFILLGKQWILIVLLQMLLFFILYVFISYVRGVEEEYKMINEPFDEQMKKKEEEQ